MANTHTNQFDSIKNTMIDHKTDGMSPTLRKNLINPTHYKNQRQFQNRGFQKFDSDFYDIGRGSLERVSYRVRHDARNIHDNISYDRPITTDKKSQSRTTTNFGHNRGKIQNLSMSRPHDDQKEAKIIEKVQKSNT